MKLLLVGDLHLRTTNPRNRIDDFFENQLKKFDWCLTKAVEVGCEAIIIPGDMTDSPHIGDYCKQRVLKLIRDSAFYKDDCLLDDCWILTVYGQHDLYFRSEKAKDKVALKVLQSAGIIDILDKDPLEIGVDSGICFYGASYGEDVPVPLTVQELPGYSKIFNILVIHKMISNHILPYDYTDAIKFFKNYDDYDLIVSGDNHQSFHTEGTHNNRFLINPGCLVRKGLNEKEYVPRVCVFDTKKCNIKWYDIPVLPAEQVFKQNVDITEEYESDPEIERLMTELEGTEWDKVSLKIVLEKYMEEKKEEINSKVRDILSDVISSLEKKKDTI